MSANRIFVTPGVNPTKGEALAGAAGILPGHLIEYSGVDVIVNNSADDPAAPILFADINIGDNGTISDAYADNETVHYGAPQKGSLVTARFGAGVTLAKGAQVASAGDGTLKAPAVAGTAVIGHVMEVVTSGVGAESGSGFGVIRVL